MSFTDKLTRLKAELQVTTDKAAAEALGLSKQALHDRKRRGAFPDDKLKSLKNRRPLSPVDAHYVLTGVRRTERTLSRRLAAERRRVGMSVKRFAQTAGVSLEVLLEWITGVSRPSLHQLDRLAAAGVDTCYVLTGQRSAASAPNVRACLPATALERMRGRQWLCEQVQLAEERAGQNGQAVVMVAIIPRELNAYDYPEVMPNLPVEHIEITQLPHQQEALSCIAGA